MVVGLSLIPAFGTLYQRLRLPESTRFAEARARALQNDEDDINALKTRQDVETAAQEKAGPPSDIASYPPSPTIGKEDARAPAPVKEKGHFGGEGACTAGS